MRREKKKGVFSLPEHLRPPSPISMSLKAISEPESLISISPFSVNMMFISVRSIMQPTTSPDCHWRPNGSFPTCQRCACEATAEFSCCRILHRCTAAGFCTDLETVEDVRQLVGAQLSVGANAGPGPAHSHLAHCDGLELKVPLALRDGVRFLRPEDADLVSS